MYSMEKMEEIKLLNQFHLDSASVGIKVHAQQATKAVIAEFNPFIE